MGGGRINPPRPVGAQAAGQQNRPVEKVKYFDDKGNLRVELVDREAEEQARGLKDVRTSQLRRYYEDVLGLRRRLEYELANRTGVDEEAGFAALRPEFKMLRAKAYYANKRSAKVFPEEFKQFFERHVQSVETAKQFRAFCKHFEAVVAFHKVYAKE